MELDMEAVKYMTAGACRLSLADEALIPSVAKGDEQAVETLLVRYWKRAYWVALQMTGDATSAEDVAQDSFVSLLRRASQYDAERGSFKAWFFRIVRNKASDHRRSTGRRKHHETLAPAPSEQPSAPSDEVEVVLEELAKLAPDLRSAVTLRHVEGMSYREIGEALGWPEGTATTRAARGMKKLRAQLERREARATTPPAVAGLLKESWGTAPVAPTARELLRAAGLEGGGATTAASVGLLKVVGGTALAVVLALGGWVGSQRDEGQVRPGTDDEAQLAHDDAPGVDSAAAATEGPSSTSGPSEDQPRAVEAESLAAASGQESPPNSGGNTSSNHPRPDREIAGTVVRADEGAPSGWEVNDSHGYEVFADTEEPWEGLVSACLRSKPGADPGLGTLTQTLAADAYRGYRVSFTARVRIAEHQRASLVMRVNGPDGVLAFDNMQGRPIRGGVGWALHEIVLDVPQEATTIYLGCMLHGAGAVWLDDLRLEIVPLTVPSTDLLPQVMQRFVQEEQPEPSESAETDSPASSDEPERKLPNAAVNLAFLDAPGEGEFPLPGWRVGSEEAAQAYEVDRSEEGRPTALVRSTGTHTDGWQAVVQTISAQTYRGQRVQLSGWLRSAEVSARSGLLLLVDGPGGRHLVFDDMGARALSGTTPWTHYGLVVDVPQEAEQITIGFQILGRGTLSVSELRLETVPASVLVTADAGGTLPRRHVPGLTNPGFESSR